MEKQVKTSTARLILGIVIAALVFALGMTITFVVADRAGGKSAQQDLVSQPAAVYPDGTVKEGERRVVTYDGTEKTFVLSVPTLSKGKIGATGTGADAVVSADGKTITQTATDAGKYSVTVSLSQSGGKWAADESVAPVVYEWEIVQAENAWAEVPQDTAIDYGTGTLQAGVAKFGNVSYALSYPHGGEQVTLDETTPVGVYHCVATVEETDSYTELKQEFEVQVLRALQSVSQASEIERALQDSENCRGIRLTGDVTLTAPIELTRAFEIDLNGHTLSGGVKVIAASDTAGDVVVRNGKIAASASGLTVPDGELVSLTDEYYYALVLKNAYAKTSLQDVEIESAFGGVATVGANVTLTDCTLTQTQARGAAIGAYLNGTANAVGCTVDAQNIAMYINVAGGAMNVYGGTFAAATVLRTKPDLQVRPSARYTVGLYRDDRNATYHADVNATFGQNPVFRRKAGTDENKPMTDVGVSTDFYVGSAAGLDFVSYVTNHSYWNTGDMQYYGYTAYGHWNGNITLTSDIYMSALDKPDAPYYFTPICWDRTLEEGDYYYDTIRTTNQNGTGCFEGVFDGQGHTIYDLKCKIDENINYSIGLVGYISYSSQTPNGGTLRDITLARASVTSDTLDASAYKKGYAENIGFFAGNATLGSRFERLRVRNSEMRFAGGKYVGSIAGYMNGGDVYSCEVSGITIDVTALLSGSQYIEGRQVGGIAGFFVSEKDNAYILNCVVENTTIKGVYQIGGLCGTMQWANGTSQYNIYGNTVSNVTIEANRAMAGGTAHKGAADKDDVHYLLGRIVANDAASGTAAQVRSKLNHTLAASDEVTKLALGRNATTGSTLRVTLADGTYYTFTPNDEGAGEKQLYDADGTANGSAQSEEVR